MNIVCRLKKMVLRRRACSRVKREIVIERKLWPVGRVIRSKRGGGSGIRKAADCQAGKEQVTIEKAHGLARTVRQQKTLITRWQDWR